MNKAPAWAVPMGSQVGKFGPTQHLCEKCGTHRESISAAKRIREELFKADEGKYGTHGWASYISREDVEAVVKGLIG